jgi:serine/threonine protein kinase/Tol biopolymer transport system component
VTAHPLSLSPGDRLGRYEILELLGAGGMGEVYRARDPELHRDVALKVLQRTSASAEDLARFTREARAAGSLNHANIVAVFDVGAHLGIPYVVTELLEGETLRARLDRGPLPFRKAIEYAIQIAQALDAVHTKNIWHRDVKPANVFITHDGRAKILDFGIAKLAGRPLAARQDDTTARLGHTETDLGTLGYMSPEQIVGEPADHRADIFAFGAVLYEMFTNARAFRRPSATEMRAAVLHEDPADPLSLNPALPSGAAAVVRRCLEKNKEERFQSARDLAFDLSQMLEQFEVKLPPVPVPRANRRWIVGVAAGAVAATALWWFLARPPIQPTFDQLTFRRARIGAARFVSDGRAVVYSEAQPTSDLVLWRHDLSENPPARPLDYPPNSDILSARSGEIALLVKRRFIIGERFVGTLAVAPLGGGSPQEQIEDVEDADWDPAGAEMALVRSSGGMGGRSWLEYPVGTKLYESSGSIRFPRVSRDRRYVAFVEDLVGSGEGGLVVLVDLGRGKSATKLTEDFKSERGLAWSSDGTELWFAAGDSRSTRTVRGVTLQGKPRVVLSAPGSLALWDVARDGRVLLTRDDDRRALVAVGPADTVERDLSWYDDSGLADISDDGRRLLFSDRSGIYLGNLDGTMPARLDLKDAYGDDLSPDGKRVLATKRTQAELMILPTGPGRPHSVPAHNIVRYSGARWFPDGHRILFSGREAGRDLRSYVQDLNGGPPAPVTPEKIWGVSIAPDGSRIAAIGDVEPGISIWPVNGGPSAAVPGSTRGDRPVTWSKDGRSLWIFRRGEVPATVFQLDIATGRRLSSRQVMPSDLAGVYSITEFAITPDGRAYSYSYRRQLSQLYLVSGTR